jgi:hypothetical protein
MENNKILEIDEVKMLYTWMQESKISSPMEKYFQFVSKNIQKNNWEMFFQSGNSSASIFDGAVSFEEIPEVVFDCLAIIKINNTGGN